MKQGVILLAILVLSGNACSQELGEMVTVSPSVGDTLNLTGRNRLGIFNGISGFRWAVFYLTDDSVVNARVEFENGNGILTDTILIKYGYIREVHSSIMAQDSVSVDSAQVALKDGTLLSVIILGETRTKLILSTRRFGQVVVPKTDVESVTRMLPQGTGRYLGTMNDPNQTRAFLMPTAVTTPAGTGYVGDYELIFFTAAVGVTDWLMVNGGTLLLPLPVEDMIFDYGMKLRLFEVHDKFGIAAGVQMFGGGLVENVSGIGYGIVSVGNRDRRLNFAFGDAFSGSGNEGLFGISGDTRLSASIKLMAELWVLEHGSWAPLVLGVRFFGSRLSGDIGLLYPLGESLGSPIGIPVVSIVYTF